MAALTLQEKDRGTKSNENRCSKK